MFNLKSQKFKWGLILIAIGSVVWAHNYGLLSFSFSFSRDWPVVLIAFGLFGVWKSFFFYSEKTPSKRKRRAIGDVLRDIERGAKTAEDAVKELSSKKNK